jgi:hypothetical protein
MNVAEKIRDAVDCRNCHSPMELRRTKKYPGKWSLVLVVSGVFCCLFFIGVLVGIPMLLLGIYMATARQTISHCPNCGHYFKVWVKEEGSG